MSRGGLRIIVDGRLPGALNMAIDEVLLAGAATRFDYTMRLYGWARPTVSLGYGQKWREGFEPTIAARERVDVVRRRTGGRAVLHADELTYSIVGPTKQGPFEGGVQSTYRVIAGGLADGLRQLGANVDVVRSKGRRTPPDAAACFSSRALYEIVADGRKLVGSAQRRQRGRVLQHGSLPIGAPDPRLWMAMGSSGVPAISATIGLESLLGQRPGWRNVASALARGVAANLKLQPACRGLSVAEWRAARRIERVYRDPAFTRSR